MSVEGLIGLWEGASTHPFSPAVGKNSQFAVGFILLLSAFIVSGIFAFNRSLATVPALGIPASLAFGFGAVYMICAVGVYV
ncbi:hypothetical protein P152DRAFT_404373 [Eremomyces bilateralis CBS 781.70]|uniref:Dolichyl-diphosphooligosaccharide-protein glycosyltransferase subunit OST5 n=1 Tax=Eremomyces bilateralis CBS 781.70 TaxID=1392243 RepID=A0A6G1FTB3_9PEZI|nr:uncharacterized protein P152DRAFT_404373 [Eremomyces bilateralis CBS 781.70]KAF1808901.1 hypothetical protein P152DRAFT_404373 [Eremomyces bilateralis CBS 781.70]